MARVLHNLLLFLIGLAQRTRVVGYWALIYGYCALCTVVALLKLCWSIVLRPTATFRWTIRESPPACLNDTSLGTHCYVRIKVRHARTHAHAHALGHERCLVPARVKKTPLCCSDVNCYNTFFSAVSRREKPQKQAWCPSKSRGICLFMIIYYVFMIITYYCCCYSAAIRAQVVLKGQLLRVRAAAASNSNNLCAALCH